MPKMEAIIDTPFGVGIRMKGETFEATEHEAKILEALKRARRLDADTEADDVSKRQPDASKKPVKTNAADKGEYTRRDMKAE